MAIPGTHDTGSRTASTGWALTIRWSVLDQLNAGIRMFDVRIRQYGNDLIFCHGVDKMDESFLVALRQIDGWLESHKGEFLIMRIKHEGGGPNGLPDPKPLCERTLRAMSKVLGRGQWSPSSTLDSVRGKILPITDWSSSIYPKWGNNTSYIDGVDDYNQLNDSKKVVDVVNHIIARQNSNKLVVSFWSNSIKTSAQGIATTILGNGRTGTPCEYAMVLNRAALEFFEQHKQSPYNNNLIYGIHLFDFPGEDLIRILARLSCPAAKSKMREC
eukprot:NODE_2140_length_978_cov_460.899892_g1755_i0.p1 GENE.NODE_2140_length_978_cov_460.899892_g1755_i0~~NODE_2140_length_978_cov_460.899892_g1755_i0.p1  ORF type:complete len:289 (+),score=58.94 NODE_2140_length_978_cov_460.899892_g1755_i0:54-869(+)